MKTKRQQNNHLMTIAEKEAYVKIIRRIPWIYEPIMKELGKYVQNATTLTDIGCGDGIILEKIHKEFPHLLLAGIDPDEWMIERAKERLPFDFKIADAETFKGHSDIIISNLALHHFNEAGRAITRLYESCKQTLIISDQLRPATENELDQRLALRQDRLGDSDELFYRQNAKSSILEAYDRDEIISTLNSTGIDYDISFYDQDYYERFVAILKH